MQLDCYRVTELCPVLRAKGFGIKFPSIRDILELAVEFWINVEALGRNRLLSFEFAYKTLERALIMHQHAKR